MRVGILNLMPPGSFEKTESQFFEPLNNASGPMQIEPVHIKLDGYNYGNKRSHVQKNYVSFADAKDAGLDALIITGSGFGGKNLEDALFYEPLKEILEWANSDEGPTSTLTSCMGTHAFMQIMHGESRNPIINRDPDMKKLSGLFTHDNTNIIHPLTSDVDSSIIVPHSRKNEVHLEQYLDAGMLVLAHSEEAGVHLATSKDGLRFVTMQGHQEYNGETLLDEFLRDSSLARKNFLEGKDGYNPPEIPQNCVDERGIKLLQGFAEDIGSGLYDDAAIKRKEETGESLRFPMEEELYNHIVENHTPNQFTSSGHLIFSNWLMAVQVLTNMDPHKPFMDGVDPKNPFKLPKDQTLHSKIFNYSRPGAETAPDPEIG